MFQLILINNSNVSNEQPYNFQKTNVKKSNVNINIIAFVIALLIVSVFAFQIIYKDNFDNNIDTTDSTTNIKKENDININSLLSANTEPTKTETTIIETTKTETTEKFIPPVQFRPANGFIYTQPDYCESFLTVTVKGLEDYFVILTNTYDKEIILSFYIRSNSTVEIDAPLGNYKLYYTCGKTWYGPEYKFFEEATYYTSDETFEFYQENNKIYGYTLELYLQTNGNFDTYNIKASDFPLS